MKRVQLILLAVLLATIAAVAQSKPDASKQSAQPTTPATTAAPQNPANPAKTLPQAKTQEEFKAYQDAIAIIQKGDPAQSEATVDAFASKFKNSEIKTMRTRPSSPAIRSSPSLPMTLSPTHSSPPSFPNAFAKPILIVTSVSLKPTKTLRERFRPWTQT
jgi:hypothetical protein